METDKHETEDEDDDEEEDERKVVSRRLRRDRTKATAR